MYTNTPIHEVQGIVGNNIDKNNNISREEKEEIINLLNTILEQNYIEHNGQWYKQNEGPTSAILAETFMQHLENTIIVDILKKFQIMDYHRYVDNILIVYNTRTTNINNALDEFSKVHARNKFAKKRNLIIKLTIWTYPL
jgi:hypothetical protein